MNPPVRRLVGGFVLGFACLALPTLANQAALPYAARAHCERLADALHTVAVTRDTRRDLATAMQLVTYTTGLLPGSPEYQATAARGPWVYANPQLTSRAIRRQVLRECLSAARAHTTEVARP